MNSVADLSRERSDLAVILARGKSARMGRSKGLICLEKDGAPLVRIIAEMYVTRSPVIVVVGQREQSLYEQALTELSEVMVVGCETGADTALSVWLGWQAGVNQGYVSHLWAHPVDLPLVKSSTLDSLAECSSRFPGALVRPVFGAAPGHPVVIPAFLLQEIQPGSTALAGPFRDFIRQRRGQSSPLTVKELECEDSGTVFDFDTPGDLLRGRERNS